MPLFKPRLTVIVEKIRKLCNELKIIRRYNDDNLCLKHLDEMTELGLKAVTSTRTRVIPTWLIDRLLSSSDPHYFGWCRILRVNGHFTCTETKIVTGIEIALIQLTDRSWTMLFREPTIRFGCENEWGSARWYITKLLMTIRIIALANVQLAHELVPRLTCTRIQLYKYINIWVTVSSAFLSIGWRVIARLFITTH